MPLWAYINIQMIKNEQYLHDYTTSRLEYREGNIREHEDLQILGEKNRSFFYCPPVNSNGTYIFLENI